MAPWLLECQRRIGVVASLLPGMALSATIAVTPSAAGEPARVAEQFARSCALCHVSGEANAPRIGDGNAWAPRRAKGDDVLLRHTLEGVGAMPPLGYCQDCEITDFRALIDLMAPPAAAATP